MAMYCIVAARPRNASNHINSQFSMYQFDATVNEWAGIGWKSIDQVSQLMRAGHQVVTGQINGDTISTGAAVELELRIARNGTVYKISAMPDT